MDWTKGQDPRGTGETRRDTSVPRGGRCDEQPPSRLQKVTSGRNGRDRAVGGDNWVDKAWAQLARPAQTQSLLRSASLHPPFPVQ